MRKIIHIDMDAFYASVEIRDRPELKGLPVVIGGPPESRGVVSTASYEARKFGVRSAMSSALAYKLCPQAIFLPSNFDKYIDASQKLREIFQRYTSIIEPLSLDEAYLDVSDHPSMRAVEIAQSIRNDVQSELNLTCSAGVAGNKLVAKIASDFKKPDGLTVVLPENSKDFMKNLPLTKIHGVGPATAKRLSSLGFHICQDIQATHLSQLREQLGDRLGNWLHSAARGIDERAVVVKRTRKSLGREITFPCDILDVNWLEGALHALCDEVMVRLKRKQLYGKCLTLKVKYSDFKSITRSVTIEPTHSSEVCFQIVSELLRSKTEVGKKPIRLIGFSISKFLP